MRDIELNDRVYVLPQGEIGTVSHISEDKKTVTVECESGFRWYGSHALVIADTQLTSDV